MTETPYQPTERRPLASRSWPIWQHVTAWLARRGASPNGISMAGMVAGILAGAALSATALLPAWERVGWLTAAAFIQLRLLANLLDGMVAIASGRASPVGELYNEVPDRVSDAAIFIGAGYAVGGDEVLGFSAACVALLTAYVRAMGKAAGAPQEFCGPMAKPQRMALMTVVAVYCGLAPHSWQPTWHDPPHWGLTAAALAIIIVGGLVTALRRLVRIAGNLRRGRP